MKTFYNIFVLGPIHIVLYIRIVRIWYNVRIAIDYHSYIVRISFEYRVNENVNGTVLFVMILFCSFVFLFVISPV